MKKILCIEDDKNVLFFLEKFLENRNYDPICFDNPLLALEFLKNSHEEYPVIITDLKMPHLDGIQLIEEIKKIGIKSSIIVITAYGEIETAVKALRLGASNYIQKPFNNDELLISIEKAFEEYFNKIELQKLKNKIQYIFVPERLNFVSEKMKKILEFAIRAAKSDAPIYLTGESGVGKEVLANFIHEHSLRSKGPFVPIDCGAIPETLLENELFGHVKGAFTGANYTKKGLIETANKGTLFLDELTNANLNIQAKLLRFVETKKFLPLGSSSYKEADVRIIAASQLHPEEAVKKGLLREDLYYRLKVFIIEIPPLRERKEDIIALSRYFLNELEEKYSKGVKTISKEALEILTNYNWPGNIRELRNVIERAYIMADGNKIEPEHLLIENRNSYLDSSELDYKKAKEEFEKIYFIKLLKSTNYNIQKAAKKSGLTRQLIYQKIKKYKIPLKR